MRLRLKDKVGWHLIDSSGGEFIVGWWVVPDGEEIKSGGNMLGSVCLDQVIKIII